MKQKIKEIAAQVFETQVNDDTNQDNCENWDSLRHLNFIIELETEFDVSFEPEEIAAMTSLSIVESMIQQKRQ
ncbi:MAG TPA: acyl carrier protein [Ignavibacteriaceae bacterium]|jgi:acyl carrier protein|nr:acyl carrier protein [Sedimentibacter sp.]HQF43965.1 acyl carrier protein [Ignavibacteriaceae bacterium]